MATQKDTENSNVLITGMNAESERHNNLSLKNNKTGFPTTIVVDWESADDPTNPINWSKQRKWCAITLVAYITFVTSFGSTIFAPGVPGLLRDFNNSNEELASFIVSICILGFCVGPLFLGPLSELYGRFPVYYVANILFLVFTIACAVSSEMGMFVFFRLCQGISACPPLVLGGGTIADLMIPVERGRALSIWAMGPLLGPVIGPVIGGFMAQEIGWRWTFWFTAIMTAVGILGSHAALPETYEPTILEKKAARLRKNHANLAYKSKFDKDESRSQHFKQAIIRPTKMLLFSPIVAILAIDMSIIYSYLYFLFTTFTVVFEGQYGFNPGEVAAQGAPKPEDRLPPLIVGAFLIPIGLIWYGWTAKFEVHWIVPILGTTFIGIGTMCAFLLIQMYLIDTFGIYAARALATNTVVRSLFGAVLPLAGRRLYGDLGLGWGNSVLAFIALALSPVPFLLLRYGERIKTHPRFQVKL